MSTPAPRMILAVWIGDRVRSVRREVVRARRPVHPRHARALRLVRGPLAPLDAPADELPGWDDEPD